eukprot:363731-Chlamydomonas_euryale.AAC.2
MSHDLKDVACLKNVAFLNRRGLLPGWACSLPPPVRHRSPLWRRQARPWPRLRQPARTSAAYAPAAHLPGFERLGHRRGGAQAERRGRRGRAAGGRADKGHRRAPCPVGRP